MDQPTKDSPQAQRYKKGDILWVAYRGKEWPAKVTAYYPKQKKISHIWFPLNRKSVNSVFKTDEARVRPFTVETKLPHDADENLKESYSQAMRILHGATDNEIIQEHERNLAELSAFQQKSAPKSRKSLSAMNVLKKSTTPRLTPKQSKQSGKLGTSSSATAVESDFDELPVPSKFIPGDTIIVDTKIGMWPGMFHSYVEDDLTQIRYTLFPRTEPIELLTGPVTSLLHFPLDQIESSIQDFNGSEVLMQALSDARNYLQTLQTQTVGSMPQQQSENKPSNDKRENTSATIFELAMSEDAHQYLRNFLDGITEEQFNDLQNTEFFHLNFRTNGLLSFKETEKLVAEIQQWIKLSNKVPTLTQLRELFYIATCLLPEICAFALSKQQAISLDEARRLYEEKREM